MPDEKRRSLTYTLVFIDEDGAETVAHGTIGRIGREERGDHGFGYDPLFLPDVFEDGRTLAEALPGRTPCPSRQRPARAAREARAGRAVRLRRQCC
ncbi:MAG: non-canonical purine NTP pyrophosphatase [Eggerthellaceae bacterium]